MSMKTVLMVILLCVAAMMFGCEDRTEATEVVDAPVAIGGPDGTPCGQGYCRVEHENGKTTDYTCGIHRCIEEQELCGPSNAETSVIDFDMWIGQAESVVDSNDYLIRLSEDWDIPDTLTIETESGTQLVLSFEGDELNITGDADMNEAAQMFFNEVLKSIADDYIRSRIQ